MKSVIAVACSALLLSCGIDSYPYLSPPESSSIREPLTGETSFIFSNNTENNANYFEGFELYYKFYSTDPGDTQFSTDQSSVEITSTREKLETVGYKRLYEYPLNLEKPLIPIGTEDKNSEFQITVDFSGLDETKPYPEVLYLSNSLQISRYVQVIGADSFYLVSFRPDDFSQVYTDISSSSYSVDYPFVYLSLYVLTYGTYDIIYDLYSIPAYLGRILVKTNL